MIILHHLNNSRSQRILWLLEELELVYEIKRYERDPVTQLAPDSLKKIHPLGKSPVLTDGEQVIAESGAIVEYLVGQYGTHWRPESAADQQAYTYWLHYAEGSLMPFLLMKLVFDKVRDSPVPFFIKPIMKGIHSQVMKAFLGRNLKNNFAFIENHLAQHKWFAGPEISGADIQMSFPLEAGLDRIRGDYPEIKSYLQRIHDRPAYQKALKAGGEYIYA